MVLEVKPKAEDNVTAVLFSHVKRIQKGLSNLATTANQFSLPRSLPARAARSSRDSETGSADTRCGELLTHCCK